MRLVKCWEYYFNSINRKYDKRKFAVNIYDITCFFEYHSKDYNREVLRVFLNTGAYHDVDMTYKEFCDVIESEGKE